MIVGAARTAGAWRPGGWLAGGGQSGADRDPALELGGVLAVAVLVALKLALWAAVPEGIAGWPADWRRYFNFLYPWPVFRPLILAPLWGRWALILASGVGRAAPGQGGAVTVPVRSSLSGVLGWLVALTVLTAIYCGRHGQWMIGCIIGLAVLGCTFLFAVLTSRRFGGHTRASVYAAGLSSRQIYKACPEFWLVPLPVVEAVRFRKEHFSFAICH